MSLQALIAKQKAAQEAKAKPATSESKPAPAGLKLSMLNRKLGASPAAKQEKDNDSPANQATLVGKASVDRGTQPASVDLDSVDMAPLTLDDISESTIEGLDQSDRGDFAFDDEIPCTAPVRDLPEDLTTQQKQFVAQLDSIYEIVHDPELFGQMIRTIMQEMQENGDYTNLLADQDVHTMLRGLRQSMGLARVKKQEKVSKTRKAKAAPATSQLLGTAEDIFNAEDW